MSRSGRWRGTWAWAGRRWRGRWASQRPPQYERPAVVTSFAPFEALVVALLKEHPELPATVLAERVGWTGSITCRDNVRRLRPEHRPVDPADRLQWSAGDVVQCDLWFPPRKIDLEDGSRVLLPALVMTAAHSRCTLARMILTRRTEDLPLATWSSSSPRSPGHSAPTSCGCRTSAPWGFPDHGGPDCSADCLLLRPFSHPATSGRHW